MSSHSPAGRHRLSAAAACVAGRTAIGVCVVLVGAVAACGGSGGAPSTPPTPSQSSSQQPLGFRSAPAFLPKTTEPVDRVVTASAARPQLAVQGVAVEVDLPSGHVLANVVGPKVPPFVAPPPPAVTATFEITLAHVTGTVPVRLGDFTITDQLGRTFHPGLVERGKRPPATVSSGRALAFEVTAVMPTGEGRLHWTPTGSSPVVSWDFIVEND